MECMLNVLYGTARLPLYLQLYYYQYSNISYLKEGDLESHGTIRLHTLRSHAVLQSDVVSLQKATITS